MSSDLGLGETTPNNQTIGVSSEKSQSATAAIQSAHTSNPTTADASVTCTSIASNTSNDLTESQEPSAIAPEAKPDGHCKSQNASNNCKPERRDDIKRRRTRRARRRKWRLDYRSRRLQWSESTEQEVRRLHMKVLEHGQPLAPYNTTQFIMNEHNSDKDIDFEAIRGRLQRLKRSQDTHQSASASNEPNDDDFYSSPEDESDYLQQQFHEAYDNIHAERLSAMNKNELVQEYLQLEDRVEDLERKLKETTNAQILRSDLRTTVSSEVQTDLCYEELEQHQSSSESMDFQTDETQNCHFKEQIKRLSNENQRLRSDNERLKRIVDEQHIVGRMSTGSAVSAPVPHQ